MTLSAVCFGSLGGFQDPASDVVWEPWCWEVQGWHRRELLGCVGTCYILGAFALRAFGASEEWDVSFASLLPLSSLFPVHKGVCELLSGSVDVWPGAA